MIRFITGLPGAGKTLRLTQIIRAYLSEGRNVYVAGVDGFSRSVGFRSKTRASGLSFRTGPLLLPTSVRNGFRLGVLRMSRRTSRSFQSIAITAWISCW